MIFYKLQVFYFRRHEHGVKYSGEAFRRYKKGVKHSGEAFRRYKKGVKHSGEAFRRYKKGVKHSGVAFRIGKPDVIETLKHIFVILPVLLILYAINYPFDIYFRLLK
ncbi:MAG: hypothetical protein LBK94_02800 [Prevotellaceae bacterium]|jgi:hypothetical protein|nr:hypothetical protein [Prevotellaceae bacterium]